MTRLITVALQFGVDASPFFYDWGLCNTTLALPVFLRCNQEPLGTFRINFITMLICCVRDLARRKEKATKIHVAYYDIPWLPHLTYFILNLLMILEIINEWDWRNLPSMGTYHSQFLYIYRGCLLASPAFVALHRPSDQCYLGVVFISYLTQLFCKNFL